MKKFAFIFFTLCVALASCKTQLYLPTEANTTANVSLSDLQLGRKLYINSCSSCHALYLPSQFPAYKWKNDVKEMKERAKISDADAQLILQYLISEK